MFGCTSRCDSRWRRRYTSWVSTGGACRSAMVVTHALHHDVAHLVAPDHPVGAEPGGVLDGAGRERLGARRRLVAELGLQVPGVEHPAVVAEGGEAGAACAAGGRNDVGHGGSPYLACAPCESSAPDLLAAHGGAGGDPVGEPRRGAARRPPRGAAAGRCRTSRSSASALNLVARTQLGRSTRVLLAGHTDTVPVNGNAEPRIDGDVLWGLGSADMKGGLAVMLALAEAVAEPGGRRHLRLLRGGGGGRRAQRPRPPRRATGPTCSPATSPSSASRPAASWRPGARARCGSRSPCAGSGPTPPGRGWVATPSTASARCCAWSRASRSAGRSSRAASTARRSRRCVVSGGVAGNVVPDVATVTLNRRFAPDRTEAEAADEVRALLAPVLEDGDERHASSTARRPPRPASTTRSCASLVDRHAARGHRQARLDRRGPLRGARRARVQPRPRRRHPRPHRRRARRPRVARPRLRASSTPSLTDARPRRLSASARLSAERGVEGDVVPVSAWLTGQPVLAASAAATKSSATDAGDRAAHGEVDAGDALARLERDRRPWSRACSGGRARLGEAVRERHREARRVRGRDQLLGARLPGRAPRRGTARRRRSCRCPTTAARRGRTPRRGCRARWWWRCGWWPSRTSLRQGAGGGRATVGRAGAASRRRARASSRRPSPPHAPPRGEDRGDGQRRRATSGARRRRRRCRRCRTAPARRPRGGSPAARWWSSRPGVVVDGAAARRRSTSVVVVPRHASTWSTCRPARCRPRGRGRCGRRRTRRRGPGRRGPGPSRAAGRPTPAG